MGTENKSCNDLDPEETTVFVVVIALRWRVGCSIPQGVRLLSSRYDEDDEEDEEDEEDDGCAGR